MAGCVTISPVWLHIITDSVVGMTTQLQVHTNKIPTFEFVNHGSFQVVRLIVTSHKGEDMTLTVFLPEGSSHGDIMKSLADATVQDKRNKEEVMC